LQPLKRSYAAGRRFSGRRPMTSWLSQEEKCTT
jgi:hypothetical protein